jgi:hypothetical protein
LINEDSKVMSSCSAYVSIHPLVALAQNQQGSSHIDANGKERKTLKDGELPPELDFFKYATAGSSKRKPSGPDGEGHARTKRHRKDESVDGSVANADDKADGDSSMTTNPNDNSGIPRQRVTMKGNNAPRRADTFKELRDRYRIHPQLMDNLERYGYEDPTGIQSAGCPILLEVSSLIVLYNSIDLIVAVSRFGCYIPNWHRKDIILPFASFYSPQVSGVKLYGESRERHPCGYSGSNARVGTPNL